MHATRTGPPNLQTPLQRLQSILEDEADRIGLEEINLMLQAVWDRKLHLEEQQKEFNLGLLTKFLQHAKYGHSFSVFIIPDLCFAWVAGNVGLSYNMVIC